MPISPQNMLDFAVGLVTQATKAPSTTPVSESETLFRSASSRAYYAAFNTAIEWAKSNGYVPKKNSEHLVLQNWFSDRSEASLQKIGSRLQSMHGTRVDADYYLNKTLDRRKAQTVCSTARSVIDDLRSISTASK